MFEKFNEVGRPKAPTPDPVDPPHDQTEFMRWGAELQRQLAQSVGGVILRGARTVPVGTAPEGTMRPARGHADSLKGFGFRNTSTTAPTTVTLYDGHSANGTYLFDVVLAPSESAREWFGDGGIALTRGLFLVDSAGTMSGSIYLRGSEF